jgi:hypothetical protein
MLIRVIGSHLPRLDPKGINDYIANDIDQYKSFWRERIERDNDSWSLEELEERAIEIAEQLSSDLHACALFELEVKGNEQRFYASDFYNVATTLAGWEPVYLELDGETIISDGSWLPPQHRDFRVAFYVHEWGESDRLTGPTGELELTQYTQVPERLWRLAPYALVD